ncbi:hypothetical protein SK128_018774, partial [Halocaridina rubra]
MTGNQLTSLWSEGEDLEALIKVQLSSLSALCCDAFLIESQNLLIRCLQISPNTRASAHELLFDPWLLQYHQPSFKDMTLLPTTILRIMNVEDPLPVSSHYQYK